MHITASGKPPTAGTISICLDCGEPSLLDADLKPARVTPELMIALKEQYPALHRAIVAARNHVRERKASRN